MSLKKWTKLQRLIPLFTILGAGAAVILSFLNIIQLSIAENIVTTLLGLLAADALIERMEILERIESQLNIISSNQTFTKIGDRQNFEEWAANCTEISAVVISGHALISNHYGFLERKIKEGSTLKFLLLDPESDSLITYNLMSQTDAAKTDILTSLKYLRRLSNFNDLQGKCEVRILNTYLPFSMLAGDLEKESAMMVNEYHAYKVHFSDRPNVFLKKKSNPFWFSFYKKQYDLAWSNGSIWKPEEIKNKPKSK